MIGHLLNTTAEVWRPSTTLDAGGGQVVEMRPVGNLITNPSFEVDTSGWAAIHGTLTRVTTVARFGVASARYDSDTAATGSRFIGFTDRVPVTAGTQYTASAYVKARATFTDARVSIAWFDSSGVFLSVSAGASAPLTATFTRFSSTFTAPVDAVEAEPQVVFDPDPGATAAHVFADAAMFNEGELRRYGIPARLSQPSTSTRRNVDEQEADQPHAELTHGVYLAPRADVRRGDELRHASGLVLRVVTVVEPSVPAYRRADCVSRQEE